MKTTFKLLSFALLGLVLSFTSCKKDKVTQDDFLAEVVDEEETITLSKDGFTTNSNGLVKAATENYYEAGSMEYVVDGATEATFQFQSGGQGSLSKNGGTSIKSLKGKSKKTKKYTKVVVSPIVKVTGCKWIVQGIVEYYDDNNNLLATIDFGNGICNEWATKTFPNNSKPAVTFSQNIWYKKYKK